MKGARVAVIPDNDSPGIATARVICNELADVCESVKFVALDGLGEKEDLSDFLGKHRKIVEDLNALYEAAPDWTVTDADERKTDAISSDRVIENQLTELGSIRLLNEKHGENLKHHSGLDYIVWDGRRWEPSMKAAYRLVHKLGDIIRETAKDTKDPTLVGKIYLTLRPSKDRRARKRSWNKCSRSKALTRMPLNSTAIHCF